MKKLIGLAIAIVLSCTTIATGAWAYFNDREQTSTNQITAGILNLTANGADSVTATFNAASALKCDNQTYTGTITLYNAGTLVGNTLSISVNYTDSDALPNTVNMTADQTAATIEVTALTCGGADLLGGVADSQPNTYKDVQDVKDAAITIPGGMGVGDSKEFVMSIKLHRGISNDFQADGVDITITFTLSQ